MLAHWSGRTLSRAASRPLPLLMLASVILAGACNKVPLVAPSGTVITVLSTTNSVAANGSTDIVAVLIESGTTSTTTTATTAPAGAGNTVHDGTLVTFTTTLGRIEPPEARTTNGRVTVKLIADGRSGIATITAFSGGASNNLLKVNVGSAAAARVTVTANPQTLPAAGGTTTITAGVQSLYGIYYPMTQVAATRVTGFVNLVVTSALLLGVALVIIGSARRWLTMLKTPEGYAVPG